jgi:hypothetical protein
MDPDTKCRFAELFGGGQAVDRVRGQNVPKVGPTLDYLGMCIVLPSNALN